MAKKIKKYLITTEEHEIFIVRNGHEKILGFCFECQAEVEFVNLDSAVSLSGIRTREIFHLSEKGKIHSLETKTGHWLICRESLTDSKTKGDL